MMTPKWYHMGKDWDNGWGELIVYDTVTLPDQIIYCVKEDVLDVEPWLLVHKGTEWTTSYGSPVDVKCEGGER